MYEAVFACFKLPHSFERLPWDTEGNRTILFMFDGLWICNQPMIFRQQAKPAGINPGNVTRYNFLFVRRCYVPDFNFSTIVNSYVGPKGFSPEEIKNKTL